MSSLPWKPFWVGLALTGLACAPSNKAPVQVMVIDVFSPSGPYAPIQAELSSVDDVSALKGDPATLTGGARIVYDTSNPATDPSLGLTPDQLANVYLTQRGNDVRVNFLQRNGVLWPVDFHSWTMVTLYYNFERAYGYFNALGILDKDTELDGSRVYYNPEYIIGSYPAPAQVDNTFWAPYIQGFLILPFKGLQAIPMAMNRGIIAHEFSHRIWNKRVQEGTSDPRAIPGHKYLEAFNEGLADYHAAESLCYLGLSDPQCDDKYYLEASMGRNVALARDLTVANNCITKEQKASLDDLANAETFLSTGVQYKVGTVIASSLFQAGKTLNLRKALEGAVLASYDDPTSNGGIHQLWIDNLESPQAITIGKIADRIIAHISQQTLRSEVCSQFLARLRLSNQVGEGHAEPDLPSCPQSVAPADVCPPL